VIAEGRGRDQIHGLGGDDFICGEGARVARELVVPAAPGQDVAGGDAIFGGSGDDILSGGDQPDRLYGGSGDDDMQPDFLLSFPNNSCDGGDGIDTARAGCDSLSNVP
jgi:Ca2+-binding RTX toxin-like protein